MNKIKMVFILGIVALLYFSCKEKTTEPNKDITFSSQYSNCLAHGLSKGSGLDSVFNYSFLGDLFVDFSVWANCCPDSNRFAVSYRIANDTIIISVADTARNLCHCTCPYMVHAEFLDLQQDHYVVRCRVGNEGEYEDPIHLVEVNRIR
jgi:hypothetical protein